MFTKGDWKDNRPHGQGSLKTVAGMQYKGGFCRRTGRRTRRQIDKDGNRFEGFFKQGKKKMALLWKQIKTER